METILLNEQGTNQPEAISEQSAETMSNVELVCDVDQTVSKETDSSPNQIGDNLKALEDAFVREDTNSTPKEIIIETSATIKSESDLSTQAETNVEATLKSEIIVEDLNKSEASLQLKVIESTDLIQEITTATEATIGDVQNVSIETNVVSELINEKPTVSETSELSTNTNVKGALNEDHDYINGNTTALSEDTNGKIQDVSIEQPTISEVSELSTNANESKMKAIGDALAEEVVKLKESINDYIQGNSTTSSEGTNGKIKDVPMPTKVTSNPIVKQANVSKHSKLSPRTCAILDGTSYKNQNQYVPMETKVSSIVKQANVSKHSKLSPRICAILDGTPYKNQNGEELRDIIKFIPEPRINRQPKSSNDLKQETNKPDISKINTAKPSLVSDPISFNLTDEAPNESEGIYDIIQDVINEAEADYTTEQATKVSENTENTPIEHDITKYMDDNRQEDIDPPVANPQTPKLIELMIAPDDYPHRTFTRKEANAVKNLVQQLMLQLPDDVPTPTFENVTKIGGTFVFECSNKYTAKWLTKLFPKHSFKGLKLKVISYNHFMKPYCFMVCVNESLLGVEKLISLMDKQNPGLASSDWYIVKNSEHRKGQHLFFSVFVSEKSYLVLQACDFKPHCSLGRAHLKLLSKQDQNTVKIKGPALVSSQLFPHIVVGRRNQVQGNVASKDNLQQQANTPFNNNPCKLQSPKVKYPNKSPIAKHPSSISANRNLTFLKHTKPQPFDRPPMFSRTGTLKVPSTNQQLAAGSTVHNPLIQSPKVINSSHVQPTKVQKAKFNINPHQSVFTSQPVDYRNTSSSSNMQTNYPKSQNDVQLKFAEDLLKARPNPFSTPIKSNNASAFQPQTIEYANNSPGMRRQKYLHPSDIPNSCASNMLNYRKPDSIGTGSDLYSPSRIVDSDSDSNDAPFNHYTFNTNEQHPVSEPYFEYSEQTNSANCTNYKEQSQSASHNNSMQSRKNKHTDLNFENELTSAKKAKLTRFGSIDYSQNEFATNSQVNELNFSAPMDQQGPSQSNFSHSKKSKLPGQNPWNKTKKPHFPNTNVEQGNFASHKNWKIDNRPKTSDQAKAGSSKAKYKKQPFMYKDLDHFLSDPNNSYGSQKPNKSKKYEDHSYRKQRDY